MKRSYLVPTVTTEEDMENCIKSRCAICSVEQPLYSEMSMLSSIDGMENYSVYRVERCACAFCTLVRGGERFWLLKYKTLHPKVSRVSMFSFRVYTTLIILWESFGHKRR